MSQKTLEKLVLALMVLIVLIILFLVRSAGNIVFSLVLAGVVIGLPFWLGSLVRYRLTPAIDSLNSDDQLEDFPLYLRILIWAFVGIVLSLAWSYLVPLSFGLPLFYSRIAAVIGWKSLNMADGVWQYGWSIAFLAQYVMNLLMGFFSSDDTDFNDRFDYRD